MDKNIQILVLLLYFQKGVSGESVKEGARVEILCTPSKTQSLIIWFRLSNRNGMNYIASFHSNGNLKSLSPSFGSIFNVPMSLNTIVLKSFNKSRDSGTYSCGSLHNNVLHFGEVRLLAGEPSRITPVPPTTTTLMLSTSTVACVPKIRPEKDGSLMLCNPIFLWSLGGGCSFLLLLLIITICYCSRVRTRGCPHHYKRKRPVTGPQK